MDTELGEHEDNAPVAADAQAQRPSGEAPAAIDVAKLTARVYRLILEDLRLEGARGAMDNRNR